MDIESTLGASRTQAERRFQQLNRKLSPDSKLKQEYSKCLNEYITLQHMTEISGSHDPTGYFIPHHAVFKESTPTKLVVFHWEKFATHEYLGTPATTLANTNE